MKDFFNVKHHWLLSYIFVTLFSFILFNMSFMVYNSSFKEILVTVQNDSVQQIKNNIDSNLNILSQCASSIAVADLFDDKNLMQKNNTVVYQKYKTQINEIQKITLLSGIIDSFYVYFPQRDLIISLNNAVKPQLMYNTYHSNGNLSYDEWLHSIYSSKDPYFFIDNKLLQDDMYMPFLFSCKKAETSYGEPYSIILMSPLSMSYNQKNDFIRRNNLTIYNGNGKIIYKQNELFVEDFDIYNRTKDDYFYDTQNNERYIVLPSKSSFSDWTYVFFAPYNEYWSRFSKIKNIFLFANISGIIICFCLAYYFTKKNYTPIQSILSIFGKKSIRNTKEISDITRNIKRLINEKDMLEAQKRELSQTTIIKRLIDGNVLHNAFTESLLADNHIIFDSDYLILSKYKITNCRGLFPTESDVGSQSPIDSAFFLIINVAQDTLLQKYDAYHCTVNNEVCFIIKTNTDDTHDLHNTLKDLREKVKDFTYIETSLAISQKYTNPYKTVAANEECDAVFKHQFMFGDENCISFETINGLDKSYIYTVSDENKIINSITSAKTQQAHEYINEIFQRNLKKHLSASAANMLIYDIFSTIMRLLDNINDQEFKKQILSFLSVDSDIFSVTKKLEDAVILLCSHYSSKEKRISDEIINIIKENYHDANLSVAQIAYTLNKTPQHISKIFKQETGEMLSSYIQNYRLSIAKDLLVNSNMLINEIAENVGYSNSSVFVTAFKKAEGISPGNFRRTK